MIGGHGVKMDDAGKKKRFLGWYFRIPVVWRILAGFALGIFAGLIIGPSITVVEPLGNLMLKLLQMVVLPLIFFAIVVGFGSTSIFEIGNIAKKIFCYYLFTTLLAATFGLLLAHVFKPGLGMTFAVGESVANNSTKLGDTSISDVFLNLFPDNVIASFAKGSYLQVLIFAIFFGLAISCLRDSKDTRVRDAVRAVYTFCEGGAEIMIKITQGVLEYTPVGVFALIAVLFAQRGLNIIGGLGKLITACYSGYLFQVLVVYGFFLMLFKVDLRKFFAKVKDPMLMAFATRSSSATLPLSIKTAEEKMGISRSVCGFTLPLGSQINLDGEAYYQVLSIFFVANAMGIHFTLAQQVLLAIVVTIGTTGTAGIAGSGPVMLLAAMTMLGINPEPGTVAAAAFALVLGIDVILDMGRTCINVTGDLAGTTIVAKSEGLIDWEKWK